MKINKQILNDSDYITTFELSEVRLLKDGELDWFILIPLIDNLKEWSDLSEENQAILSQEITLLSKKLKEHTKTDKINVANIGNIVSQLHIHVIARYKNDRSWPAPIWGTSSKKQYDSNRLVFWKNLLE